MLVKRLQCANHVQHMSKDPKGPPLMWGSKKCSIGGPSDYSEIRETYDLLRTCCAPIVIFFSELIPFFREELFFNFYFFHLTSSSSYP